MKSETIRTLLNLKNVLDSLRSILGIPNCTPVVALRLKMPYKALQTQLPVLLKNHFLRFLLSCVAQPSCVFGLKRGLGRTASRGRDFKNTWRLVEPDLWIISLNLYKITFRILRDSFQISRRELLPLFVFNG